MPTRLLYSKGKDTFAVENRWDQKSSVGSRKREGQKPTYSSGVVDPPSYQNQERERHDGRARVQSFGIWPQQDQDCPRKPSSAGATPDGADQHDKQPTTPAQSPASVNVIDRRVTVR